MNKFTRTIVKSHIHDEILKVIVKDTRHPFARHEKRESLTLCSYSMLLEDKLTKLGFHCTGIEKKRTYYYRGINTMREKGISNSNMTIENDIIENYLSKQKDENKIKNDFTWLDWCGPMTDSKHPTIQNAIHNCADNGMIASTTGLSWGNKIAIGETHLSKAIQTAILYATLARESNRYIEIVRAIKYQTNVIPMLFLMMKVSKKPNTENIAEQVKRIFQTWLYHKKVRYIQG